MSKFRFLAVVTSFLMLTACGSYSKDSSAETVQSESSSVMRQSDSNDTSVHFFQPEVTTVKQREEKKSDGMQIIVGEKQFSVTLESNDTVTALTEILPLTLDMSELNGNEKYYYLDTALPSAPEKVGHINEGDIMLYGDSCIVVFYKSFDTSYRYTKIGHIEDTSELADILGTGDVTVTFEMVVGSTDIEYTIQDIRNLCDFLLAKPTEEDLRGKPYDLDNDGVWSVFDLCLMKRKILEQRNMTTESDFESKTVLLNSGYEMPIKMITVFREGAESSGYIVKVTNVCRLNIKGYFACEYCSEVFFTSQKSIKYFQKQKVPLTKQEYYFQPDEGDQIIIQFSTLTVTPDLNLNSR